MIPLIDLQSFLSQLTTSSSTSISYLETVTITVEAIEQNVEAVVVSPMAQSIHLLDILLWIYWIGVAFMLVRFLIGLFQISKLYFTSDHQKMNGYTLVLTDKDHLPFSFFNLFFRSKNIPLTMDEQEKIIQHELAHIKGKHSIDVLLLELTSILLWCSPLVHLYKKSLRNIHEYLADASVLQTTSKKHYGQLLLQMFQTSPGIALANNFIHSQLKKRIKMMTKTQSSKRAYWKYIVSLPLIALIALAMTNIHALAQTTTPNDETIKKERTHPVMKAQDDTTDPIFTVVEQMPRFPGCEDLQTDKDAMKKCSDEKMLNFIFKNISYPQDARKKGVEGVVVVRFVIDKDGQVTSPEVLRSIGSGCDEEALRIVNMMPKWVAGKQRGKNVNVYFNLPFRFKLQSDEPTNEKIDAPENTGSEEIFTVVEEMPRFPGCEDEQDKNVRQKCSQEKLLSYIQSNIKYPKSAQDKGIGGLTIVQFYIDKDGSLKGSKLLRDIGEGCGEEALRIIDLMNEQGIRWIPGKQRGEIVKVKFTLPIRFKLDKTPKNTSEESVPAEKPLIDDKLGVISMTISPNPISDGQINVSYELKNQPSNLILRVVDLNGTVLKTIKDLPNEKVNTVTIDINNAAAGSLFINLIDGDKIYTEKAVKM